MTWFKDYELVMSLDEAASLLAEPGSVIIGGGSRLVALKPDEAERLIDLMPLGLDRIRESEEELRLEARVRLEDLAQRKDFGGLLKAAILSLAHSGNLRNQMTVAGETAWALHLNEWQVALLVLDAVVERHGEAPAPIAEYLAAAERRGIITCLRLPRRKGMRYGFERVAPAEGSRPLLVLTGAAAVKGGKLAELRLAAGNLSALPQRLLALEKRLVGLELEEAASFRLQEGDREGLAVNESHNAGIDAKWRWLETCLERFFASLRGNSAR